MSHPSYHDESLNPEQLEAVRHVDGPMMILAGAGSGKTRVITHRAAYLVGGLGIAPERVLAVTFTNKAASEMRERAVALGGSILHAAQISTFHRLGVRLLRRFGERIGIDPNFSIADADDQRSVLKHVLARRGLDKAGLGRNVESHIIASIARAKDELADPLEHYAATVNFRLEPELFGDIASDYERELAASNALDFGDLLARPVSLLTEHPAVLEHLQGRYLHLMVDEYQDVNQAQDTLMGMLAGAHSNLVVVGDDDQCIYTWRGANVDLILGFADRYPGARVVRLTRNYRSSGNILECANGLAGGMNRRHEKELWTQRPSGQKITVIEASDTEDEAEEIAREIARLTNQGIPAQQIAILYRVNSQSRELETELRRFNIAYVVRGAPEFYQRREIKDLIAYLRLLHRDADLISWRRVLNTPPRGIGPGTREQLESLRADLGLPVGQLISLLASQDPDLPPNGLTSRGRGALVRLSDVIESLRRDAAALSLPELLMAVLERTGYQRYLTEDDRGEDRLENVRSLLDSLAVYAGLEPAEALGQFLEDVALIAGGDDAAGVGSDRVELMTLHRAKGLEYDCVFVCGFVDGLIPHLRSLDRDVDEERRLAYVGMTRARNRLYLSYSARARRYWGQQSQDPSRFLVDLPADLLEYRATESYGHGVGMELFAPRRSPRFEPPPPVDPDPQFAPGQEVQHATFGTGVVLESQIARGEEIVKVRFDTGETKKLAAAYARLVPVAAAESG